MPWGAACLALERDSDKVRCSSIRALGIVLALAAWAPSGKGGACGEAKAGHEQPTTATIISPGTKAGGWAVQAISSVASCLLPEASSKVAILRA